MKHEMDPFRIPASWCDYSFLCLCEITQSNNSNGAPQSLFALFAVWCCQPASQTDRLLTINLDDSSDESMNGWLAGWRGGGGDGSGEGM